MHIVREKITLDELKKISQKMPDNLVKAVVDPERHVMVVGVEMHVEGQTVLLEDGSDQENVWGITIYPYKPIDVWIEFYSQINLRPYCGNNTCGVDDVRIQEKIKKMVTAMVVR